MNYGIVIRNVTDLRAAPRFRSERKSQLLFNESVRVTTRQQGYCHVTQADGYAGWVDERALFMVTEKESGRHLKRLKFRVAAPMARAGLDSRITRDYPYFLFYGTRLAAPGAGKRAGSYRSADGRRFDLSLGNIRSLENKPPPKGEAVVKEATRFLGTPYLWGGITPGGFDCSGLVRMVYDFFDIHLPRDSREQRRIGVKVTQDEVTAGDLLFFKGHVAIAVNKRKIIHASLGGGGVTVDSLDPADDDYRADLAGIFIGARRILP